MALHHAVGTAKTKFTRLLRATLWVVTGFAVVGLCAFRWLRRSPHWTMITLFAERYRVENFRNMDKVFPYHAAVSAVEEGYLDSIRDPIGRYVPDLVGSASTAGRKSRLVVDLWLRIQVVDSRRPPGRLPRDRADKRSHRARV